MLRLPAWRNPQSPPSSLIIATNLHDFSTFLKNFKIAGQKLTDATGGLKTLRLQLDAVSPGGKAIAVALHIIHTGYGLLKRSADGLMDAALPPREVKQAETLIRGELPEGASFHALRTRKAGARRFVEFHLLVPGATRVADAHALCDRIEASLAAHLPRSQVTIHVEPSETQAPHA